VSEQLEIFKKYDLAASRITRDLEYAPYDWDNLPSTMSAQWMAYSQMFKEFSREISNVINEFANLIYKLDSWNLGFQELSKDDKFEAVHEFVDTIGTVAINLPYIIRSRFIFAVAHLCHQANQAFDKSDWVDDFPLDNEVYFETADVYGSRWKSYNKLKKLLEAIANKRFREATHHFRDKYNHRFSPSIEFGLTEFVTRIVDESSRVTYRFGYLRPLTLEQVVPILKAQYHACFSAFGQFQKLIQEHVETIEFA
jgi:hypothetical protein